MPKVSKTPEERKAYRREWMAKKSEQSVHKEADSVNNSVNKSPKSVNKITPVHKASKIQTYDIDIKLFEGKGRGVPINGYVLIDKVGVITELDWLARLKTICAHGLTGWSCKVC